MAGLIGSHLAMTDVVQLLKPLVEHRTTNPGGDEPRLARMLADALRARGADEVVVRTVERSNDAPGAWVYARFGTPRVLINAHLDTVPPNAGWTGNPFELRVENGRAMGLGACDTKGAIAACLAALERRRPDNVALLFSGDEERGTACIRDFLQSKHAEGIERAIVCEPTGCRPGLRHRGILALSFTLTGDGGHSSMADVRPAPIAALGGLAATLYEWGQARKDEGPDGFPGLCLNVAKLDGGVAFNVIPQSARLSVSLRPPPGASQAAIRDELIALARTTVEGLSVSVDLDHPPFACRSPERFRSLLESDFEEPLDLAFWTEAALLSEVGIDAVVWGPGDIALAHAPDEWVAVSELERARDRFVRLFELAGVHHAAG